MTILSILIALVVIGFALWLVAQMPLDETVKRVIVGVVIFVVILWVIGALFDVPLPRGIRWR